ncbi:MAG: LuxR C-terminal-related transcriptional regulator, partial [Hyphomicrobium sp.]
DPKFEQAMYQAMPINPLMPSGWYMDIDEPYTGVGMLGRDEYYRTRFYREVLKPFDYCDAAMTVFAKTSNRFGGLSLPHTTAQGEWSAEQLQRVRIIAPHIRRAVTIADLLDARALQQDMLSATLDLLAVGIVLVDAEARIAHTNRAGLTYLDARSAVRLDGDHLSARDPKAASELKEAIKTVVKGGATSLPRAGIAIPIQSAGGRDLAAWVLPLDSGLRSELAAPFAAKAAVFIRELGDTSAFPGELFVKRFGITPAECRVLMMLVQGLTVAETCDALGVGEPTIKTHLSRLFAKTGTSGQPDLMRLAMSALAPGQGPPA